MGAVDATGAAVIVDLSAHTTRRRFLRGSLAISGVVLLDPKGALGESITDTPGEIEAGFLTRSYIPGETAELLVDTASRSLTVQVFAREPATPTRRLVGATAVPVSAEHRLRWPGGRGILHLKVGAWPTGLYFLSLRAAHGQSGSAPLVVRTTQPGQSRVLVVLPTNTWGAYNFRDDATWYANPEVTEVDLTRPFLNGRPPHFDDYDRGFQRWFGRSGYEAAFIADDDLEQTPSGDELARLYDLIVFPGHEEYVTDHTYDVIERYQALGGNLLFLSANNFFYKVIKQGNVMQGRWRWRDLGRPEAQLIGSQYLNWYQGIYPNRPLVVSDVRAAPWLFAGTGLRDGSAFGTYGIEIDACCEASPPGVEVLATIPNIFGWGQSAQMTHYRTPNGAEVFDAGVLNFGGTADMRIPGTMVTNLWQRLASRN